MASDSVTDREQDEFKKWRERTGSRPIILLTVGQVGSGKTTLVSTLLQLERIKYSESSVTSNVKQYINERNGVDIHIFDTPGLAAQGQSEDDEREQIADIIVCTEGRADVILFCTPLLPGAKSDINDKVISMLTKAFGSQIWEKTILVLTFSNYVGPYNPFGGKLREIATSYADRFNIALKKAGIHSISAKSIMDIEPGSSFNGIVAVPAGTSPDDLLAHSKNWIASLYIEILKKCDPEAVPQLLKLEVPSQWVKTVAGFGAVGGASVLMATLVNPAVGLVLGASALIAMGVSGALYQHTSHINKIDQMVKEIKKEIEISADKSPDVEIRSKTRTEAQVFAFTEDQVGVCGETRIFVTRTQQHFRCDEFGLNLHIQEDSLPSEVQKCKIDILVSLSGQYEFPEDTHCVSAVFWFRCEPVCKFQKAVTLEMEHCAGSPDIDMLCFARAVCTQKDLPYKFTNLQNSGEFNKNSSYGVLKVSSFSGITIVKRGPLKDKEYSARLFYMNPEIHFVVTCNTKAHNTAVLKQYETKCAVPGAFQPIYFEEEEVTLDIPMKGVTVEAWTITPLTYPVVTKRQVDSYRQGKLLPCCQLQTKVAQEIKVTSVYHKVTLIGAKHPHNVFNIELPIPIRGLDRDRSLDDSRASGDTRMSIFNKENVSQSEGECCTPPLGEDDLSSIMQEVISVKPQYYALGRTLGLPPGELESIRVTNANNPEQALNDILLTWLRQKYSIETFGLPTWQRLANAIKDPAGGKDLALAKQITARHCSAVPTQK